MEFRRLPWAIFFFCFNNFLKLIKHLFEKNIDFLFRLGYDINVSQN